MCLLQPPTNYYKIAYIIVSQNFIFIQSKHLHLCLDNPVYHIYNTDMINHCFILYRLKKFENRSNACNAILLSSTSYANCKPTPTLNID